MSRFSVKKPYTVVVGVIMVILLGIISFTKTSTDLLPEMELPYVVVYTTYPGASSEQVETGVTKILESALGTTENLLNVSSVSSDNLSLIILEFAENTNMDTAMLDLSSKINQASSMLEDSVSTPIMMAMNPNMMPIMMATVDYEGKDLAELSAFVSEKISPELEKLNGVASVTLGGLLKETVEIKLDQEKIDDINYQVLSSVNKELADAEREIRNGLREVNEGLDRLKDGEDLLTDQKDEVFDQLTESSVKLQEAATTLIAMDSQITQIGAEEKTYETILVTLYSKLCDPNIKVDDPETFEKLISNREDTVNKILEAINQISNSSGMLTAILDGYITELENNPDADEGKITEIKNKVLPMLSMSEVFKDFKTLVENATTAKELGDALKQLKDAIVKMPEELKNQVIQADRRLGELEIELETAKLAKKAAEEMLKKAGINTDDLSSLRAQIDKGMHEANSGFTKGEIELSSAKAQLEATKKQLESALADLEEAKKEALEKADISALLSADMISNVLMAENFSMPAGYLGSNDSSLLVKVGEEFASLEEIENLILMPTDIKGLGNVRLKDLSTISIVNNLDESYTKVNGNDGIILSFQKTSTSSTAEVAKTIRNRFESLSKEYEGLRFVNLLDQGVYIDMIISSVLENFVYGALLAIIVLILFLKDAKPTIIIALSIPISFLFSIVLMYFSGVSLNIISLSGLALGVGMLVDNSVVVVENIYRLKLLGLDVKQAAIDGAKQVTSAIIASTLTTVCVFLPIVFTEGITRQLFEDMGLTIAYSLLASLIVALTLVPMLSSTVLKNTKPKEHPWFDRFVAFYEKTLKWSLKHKGIMVFVVSFLLVLSMFLATKMPMSLIPSMNSGQMSLSVSVLDETLDQKDCYALYDDVMEKILSIEGVESVGATSSSSMLSSGSDSSMQFYMVLDKKANIKTIPEDLKVALSNLPIEYQLSTSNMDLGALGGSGISIRLYGDDLDDLQKAGNSLKEELLKVEGIDEVTTGNEEATKELRLVVDKNRAMEYGLTVAQVYQTVAKELKAETTSINLSMDGKKYPVVIVKDDSISSVNDLHSLYLKGNKDQKEVEVSLMDLVKIENATAMTNINRDNLRRYITVNASIEEGYNVTLVSRDLKSVLNEGVLSKGIEMEFDGENETIMEAMSSLVQMILLAIAFIYMIMVAQFQSLKAPFIVLFTIPLAFTGGLLALQVLGVELSIVSMLGFLVLSGVVVNNGIVLIDYVNQLKVEGISQYDAILEAGKTRLRPILMTALTTILAMTTMALGIGNGAEMMQGMAIVTIGGLTYATVLTLYIVPILIELFEKKKRVKDDLQ